MRRRHVTGSRTTGSRAGPLFDRATDYYALRLPARLAAFMLPRVIASRGVMRYSQLQELGLQNGDIQEAIDSGTIVSIGNGLYKAAAGEDWRSAPIVQVFAKRPDAVIALRSAAGSAGLLEKHAGRLWIAMRSRQHPPKFKFRVNWLRWSDEKLDAKVERLDYDGVRLNMTSPARTVADYFAHLHRLKPGEPMAVLNSFRDSKHWNEAELLECADLCRVTKLIKTALKYG